MSYNFYKKSLNNETLWWYDAKVWGE